FRRNRIWLPAEFAKAVEDQWVPLDPELAQALKALPRDGEKVFRFISRLTGLPVQTASAVTMRILSLARRAGVRLSMHTLRKGFAHHRLDDTLSILAELGYGGVALTLDYHSLNPYGEDFKQRVSKVRHWLEKLGLRSVIETGARFLLDPRQKHQPTLISPEAG